MTEIYTLWELFFVFIQHLLEIEYLRNFYSFCNPLFFPLRKKLCKKRFSVNISISYFDFDKQCKRRVNYLLCFPFLWDTFLYFFYCLDTIIFFCFVPYFSEGVYLWLYYFFSFSLYISLFFFLFSLSYFFSFSVDLLC